MLVALDNLNAILRHGAEAGIANRGVSYAQALVDTAVLLLPGTNPDSVNDWGRVCCTVSLSTVMFYEFPTDGAAGRVCSTCLLGGKWS